MMTAALGRPDLHDFCWPLRNRLPGLDQLGRRVLHLRYWEELPIGAVAICLGLPLSQASDLERRTLAQLYGYLKHEESPL